jgi:hypothetical protein
VALQADIDEGETGQHPRDREQRRRNQLRRLRAGTRLGAFMFLLARVSDLSVRGFRPRRAVRMILGHEGSGVIVVRRRRIFARITVARANERDHAGDDGAKQRQDHNGFVHAAQPFIKFTSSTAIEPRLRK